MKLTVIAGYFPPEQSADTRLNKDFVYSLAELGVKVTLVVPFPTRAVSNDIQQEYVKKKDESISDYLRIIRVGKPSEYHQGLFRRGVDFLRKSSSLFSVAKKIETDVYLVVSTPPFLGYVAALLTKRKPVMYKLQDVFPDSLIHSKGFKESNLLIKFLRILEKWVYKRVTSIIAISDDMKRTLVNRGVSEKKIDVIYDWVDEKCCYPVDRNKNLLFTKFNLPKDEFYVCYAGNIGLLQNVGTIVMASEILAETNPEIKFIIIGDGAWKPELDKILKSGSHNNVYCFPMQPTDQIAFIYSLGDIGLVSLQPDVTKYALPSKTWNIMSAGRPVICEIDLYSTLCDIVQQNKCGYCISPGDSEGLANVLISLYNNRQEIDKIGKNARRYVEDNLTRDITCNRYYEKLKVLID